jgi:FlaA1/EpsC-like NDP-sugar epimerase
MEWNPGEAVKNNVGGTLQVVECADRHGAARFVMISTDKAVHPTSVMGCTKRVAELIVRSAGGQSRTIFVTVRFGNVLGSNGSVIPLFKEQIAAGGPVTVTHPEMVRYFMTIPEASQLVLQAGAMGQSGEVYVLDMGEPVRILSLAEDLIQLSGLRPHKDIEIVYTGVRPGEKLFEELVLDGENATKTKHPKIFVGKESAPRPFNDLVNAVDRLLALAHDGDERAIYRVLQELVPTYRAPERPADERPNVIPLRSLPPVG